MTENIFIMDKAVQLIMALLGSAGFAILFHLRRELMAVASFGGLLCWLVYLICEPVMSGYFFPSFVASACGAFYAEVLARVLKVPSTPFCGGCDSSDTGKHSVLCHGPGSSWISVSGQRLRCPDNAVRAGNRRRHECGLGGV